MTVRSTVADWLTAVHDDATRYSVDEQLDVLERAASATAAELYVAGAAAISLEPGNGYKYNLVLSKFPDPRMVESFGGDLLVALPDFHRCLLLNEGSGGCYHVPSYVDEKIGLGKTNAAVLASFLTLQSEVLASYGGGGHLRALSDLVRADYDPNVTGRT